MSDPVPVNPRTARHRRFGIARACVVLAALIALAWVIDASVTTHLAGRTMWGVSALAAGICWIAATLSMAVLHLLRLRGSPIAGVLVGMLVRMSIPLGIVVMATINRSALVEGGLAAQLVIFYLLALTAETCLSLVLVKSAPRLATAAFSEGSAAHG